MKPAILFAGGALLIAASASATVPAVDNTLAEVRRISLKLRTGQYDLAPQSVAMLESAVRAHPTETRLWSELGTAYFQQVTAYTQAGDMQAIRPTATKALAAYAEAHRLASEGPEALAGRGLSLTVAAGLSGRPELTTQGLAMLDRAVAKAPNVARIRLQRGFTHLAVSPDHWNPATAEADLVWLLRLVEGGRAGDVLHVLLGDLHAQTGRHGPAREHYVRAARAGSRTEALATGRLGALAAGTFPAADAARLRSDIGRDCVMCHGS